MAEEDTREKVTAMARTLDNAGMTSTLSDALERIHTECTKKESIDKATSLIFAGIAALGNVRDPDLKDAYRTVFDASLKYTGVRKAMEELGEKLS